MNHLAAFMISVGGRSRSDQADDVIHFAETFKLPIRMRCLSLAERDAGTFPDLDVQCDDSDVVRVIAVSSQHVQSIPLGGRVVAEILADRNSTDFTISEVIGSPAKVITDRLNEKICNQYSFYDPVILDTDWDTDVRSQVIAQLTREHGDVEPTNLKGGMEVLAFRLNGNLDAAVYIDITRDLGYGERGDRHRYDFHFVVESVNDSDLDAIYYEGIAELSKRLGNVVRKAYQDKKAELEVKAAIQHRHELMARPWWKRLFW